MMHTKQGLKVSKYRSLDEAQSADAFRVRILAWSQLFIHSLIYSIMYTLRVLETSMEDYDRRSCETETNLFLGGRYRVIKNKSSKGDNVFAYVLDEHDKLHELSLGKHYYIVGPTGDTLDNLNRLIQNN